MSDPTSPAPESALRHALIDAACAWGWDRATSAAAPERAEALLAAAGPALVGGDFVLACIAGEVDAVRAALAREPALATRPAAPRGWEPLLYASYSVLARRGLPRAARVVEVARLLLAAGADPSCHYAGGEPGAPASFPALYASIAVTDNLELTAALLEAGANPNDRQSLYHAAERFDTAALELLFAHDLDPADVSYCLLHKIDFQHEPGIRWFLDHGADPNARHPASQESALHWAIKRASTLPVIELLLARGADVDARTLAGHTVYPEVRGWTPLDLAQRLARPDIAALLRARGATATTATADDPVVDRALIAHVAQQDAGEAVLRLADAGWPLDARGWMDATPLHWAACRGNAALARALLERGAPVVDVGGYFQTPLHAALYCHWARGAADYVGVLEALVAAGVAVPGGLPATDRPELDAAVARYAAPPTRAPRA